MVCALFQVKQYHIIKKSIFYNFKLKISYHFLCLDVPFLLSCMPRIFLRSPHNLLDIYHAFIIKKQ